MKSVFTREYHRFISILIEARKRGGLSQQDLAEKLGKPQSFVSKYERGERRLDVVEFIQVCRALEISAPEIVSDLEREIPDPTDGDAG